MVDSLIGICDFLGVSYNITSNDECEVSEYLITQIFKYLGGN